MGCCSAALFCATACTLPYIDRGLGRRVLGNTCGADLLFLEEILAEKGRFCAAGMGVFEFRIEVAGLLPIETVVSFWKTLLTRCG
jgi:uncharacterized membrane protein